MTITTEFRLPQLADSVTSVRLSLWLKQVGDRVETGEPIVEVETDKTNVELEAPVSGVMQAIHVAAGTDGLEVGTLLAVIAAASAVDTAEPASAPEFTPEPTPESTHAGIPAASRSGAPVERDSAPDEVLAVASPETLNRLDEGDPAVPGGAAASATPLARRMAAVAGLTLGEIAGTGRDGRITKQDVERRLAGPTTMSPPAEDAAPGPPRAPTAGPIGDGIPGPSSGPFHDEELSALRRVTATRMQQSKQTVPHFYLRIECVADAALALLASAKQHRPERAPTLTDLVIRASAFALRKVPRANSAWVDGRVRIFEQADISVAVNTPTGLIAPIVRAADRKDLAAIATETRGLVARARDGQLRPDEYAGGTFTISNLGMYGVESLYAIVNPPQSCILGVGAVISRPVVVGREVRVGQVMACTLSADHRVIDGAVGAELLAAIRDHLEQPGLMMV
jgi:pyruvate dehydrogenase E2 component (dihydrolipoamide acetyltransferase)